MVHTSNKSNLLNDMTYTFFFIFLNFIMYNIHIYIYIWQSNKSKLINDYNFIMYKYSVTLLYRLVGLAPQKKKKKSGG